MSGYIPTTEERDRILNAWAAGTKGDDIAKDMNLRKSIVFRAVQIARKQGDPRAVSRTDADKKAASLQPDFWDKTALLQRNDKFLRLLSEEQARRHPCTPEGA